MTYPELRTVWIRATLNGLPTRHHPAEEREVAGIVEAIAECVAAIDNAAHIEARFAKAADRELRHLVVVFGKKYLHRCCLQGSIAIEPTLPFVVGWRRAFEHRIIDLAFEFRDIAFAPLVFRAMRVRSYRHHRLMRASAIFAKQCLNRAPATIGLHHGY
jgi:hypothetical protein